MKIFRNSYRISGSPELVEVDKLPRDHQKINNDIEKLEKIISEGEQAKIILNGLQKSCIHEYFYDRPGYPYDYRFCATCNGYMGPI